MQLSMLQLAEMAREAYSDVPEDCERFGAGACQGFIRRVKGAIVVAFRGTDSSTDWLSNLSIGRESVPGVGSVHEGFWQALEGGLPSIREAWAASDLNPWSVHGLLPIVCVGHSLGGALAAIFAAWLESNAGRRSCAVTFGQPKFLGRFSEAQPLVPIWRVVHRYDLVPNIPRVGFIHCGLPIYWHAGPLSRFFWRPVVGGMKDHLISRYLAHIEGHPEDNLKLQYFRGGFVMGGGSSFD